MTVKTRIKRRKPAVHLTTLNSDTPPYLNIRTPQHAYDVIRGFNEALPGYHTETSFGGIAVSVRMYDGSYLAVMCLPWSRGWSLFVLPETLAGISNMLANTQPSDHVASPAEYEGLKKRLYAPARTNGPWNVPVVNIVRAMLGIVINLERVNTAHRAAFQRKYWYWPRSAKLPTEVQHAKRQAS